jgi:hypothetical protein
MTTVGPDCGERTPTGGRQLVTSRELVAIGCALLKACRANGHP